MAKQTINNLESALTVRKKINDNFTELYEQKAEKAHAFTDPSYGVATSELFGHVKINPSNGLIINDGVLSINAATSSNPGTVKLADSLDSGDPNRVLTASLGNELKIKLDSLENNTPPKNHAVSNTDYGIATSALYGHVRVSSGNGLHINQGVISISEATSTAAGTVKLEDSLNSQSSTMALTAKQGYLLDKSKPNVHSGTTAPSNTLGRDGDIYILLEN